MPDQQQPADCAVARMQRCTVHVSNSVLYRLLLQRHTICSRLSVLMLVLFTNPCRFIFSTSAADNTQRALHDTDIAIDILGDVFTAFYTLRVVVVVLLAICLALVLLVAVLGIISKMHRQSRGAKWPGADHLLTLANTSC